MEPTQHPCASAAQALTTEFYIATATHCVQAHEDDLQASARASALLSLQKQWEAYEACQRTLPILEASLKGQIEYLKSLENV